MEVVEKDCAEERIEIAEERMEAPDEMGDPPRDPSEVELNAGRGGGRCGPLLDVSDLSELRDEAMDSGGEAERVEEGGGGL